VAPAVGRSPNVLDLKDTVATDAFQSALGRGLHQIARNISGALCEASERYEALIRSPGFLSCPMFCNNSLLSKRTQVMAVMTASIMNPVRMIVSGNQCLIINDLILSLDNL
jgi:hypothetical protein